jgi:DNA-binding response OmpR family regulator
MTDGVQRFGQVEFDELRGRLTVSGKPVKIDRTCRAILAVLVNEAGRDVPKDSLLEAGWPGRLVDENSLVKAIGRLRQALGATGEALETVHRHGYRLDVEVVRVAAATGRSVAPTGPRWLPRAALVLVAIATAGGVAAALSTLPGEAHSDAPERVHNGEDANSIGRILWVDDHPENNVVETHYLEERKIAVYHVATTEEALTLLPMYQYGAVLSDMGRGERPLAGLDLLKAMRARGDRRPFFLYTVHSSEAQRRLLAEAGGQGVAVTREELYAAILPLFESPINGEPDRTASR